MERFDFFLDGVTPSKQSLDEQTERESNGVWKSRTGFGGSKTSEINPRRND